MSADRDKSLVNAEVVQIAERMLLGQLGLIEGARLLERLRFSTANPDDDAFMLFRAIASETDDVPLGDVREKCSAEYLQKIDQKTEIYLSNVRDAALGGCQQLIRRFGPGLH